MKRFLIWFTAAAGISYFPLSAQPARPGFLFDRFEQGRVVYKTGGQVSGGRFNYDTVNEKALFVVQDTVVLELDRTDVVSELWIGDRTFEHAGNGIFYERIPAGGRFLYVRRRTKVVYEEAEGGYGTRPTTGAIDRASQFRGAGGSLYRFDTGSNYRLVEENVYYLPEGDDEGFQRIASFKALARQFGNCRSLMKAYVKREGLNFKAPDDVVKAVAYGVENCN